MKGHREWSARREIKDRLWQETVWEKTSAAREDLLRKSQAEAWAVCKQRSTKKACVVGAKQPRGGEPWQTLSHLRVPERQKESLRHRRICYWEGPQNALAWRVITKSINRKVISHQNSLISLGSRRVSHKDPKHWYTISKKPRRTFIDDRLTWNWGCTNIAFSTSLWPSGSWNNAKDNPKIFRAARGYSWRSLDLLPCWLLLSLSLPPVHTSQTLTQYLVLENSILIGLHREPA